MFGIGRRPTKQVAWHSYCLDCYTGKSFGLIWAWWRLSAAASVAPEYQPVSRPRNPQDSQWPSQEGACLQQAAARRLELLVPYSTALARVKWSAVRAEGHDVGLQPGATMAQVAASDRLACL